MAANSCASVIEATSSWMSCIINVRRSSLQQLNRAMGSVVCVMAMPTLYMFHWRVNEDHWSGLQPRPILGGSSFNFCCNAGAGAWATACALSAWIFKAVVSAAANSSGIPLGFPKAVLNWTNELHHNQPLMDAQVIDVNTSRNVTPSPDGSNDDA